MKKFLAGILAFSACFVFSGCDFFSPSSGGTGVNNGGLGNLGGNGTTTTLISEKVANETAWQNAFDGIDEHFTFQSEWTSAAYDSGAEGGEYSEDTAYAEGVLKDNELEVYAKLGVRDSENEEYTWVYEARNYYKQINDELYEYNEEYYQGWVLSDHTLEEEILWSGTLPLALFVELETSYADFKYNSIENVYESEMTLMSYVEAMEAPSKAAFEKCYDCFSKIWIKNGKVVRMDIELDYDSEDTSGGIYITCTFGVGEPNLPEFVMPE